MTVKFRVFFFINKMIKYERTLMAKNHGAQVYLYLEVEQAIISFCYYP